MSETSTSHKGQCYCGQVQVDVGGDPVFSAYCHCPSCRTWHGAPIAALAAWPTASVTVTGDVVVSPKTEETQRTSCAKCGGHVLTIKPTLDWAVVYPMTLAGSGFQYEPNLHIFYGSRVLDVTDGLPKFEDVPSEAGGSGVMIGEPASSGWCSRPELVS